MATSVRDKINRQLDFQEWREKMRIIIESGTSGMYNSVTGSSGYDYQDGSPSELSSLKQLMKNLHDVMELSIETNIQLTNAVNNLSFMQKKFAEDYAKFQNSIQLQFDNFQKVLDQEMKRTAIENSEKNHKDDDVQKDESSNSSIERLSESSKSNFSYFVMYEDKDDDNQDSPVSESEKCKGCARIVSHRVSECPYKVNYNKVKSRKEKNSKSSLGKKRKNSDSETEYIKKRPSRWDLNL